MRWHRSERRHSGGAWKGGEPRLRRRGEGVRGGRGNSPVGPGRRRRGACGVHAAVRPFRPRQEGFAVPPREIDAAGRRVPAALRRSSSWRPSGSRRFTGVSRGRVRDLQRRATLGQRVCRSPRGRVCARGEGGVSVDPADERPPRPRGGGPRGGRGVLRPAARSRMSCWRPPGSPAFPRCTASAARRRSPRSPTGRSPSRAST